MTDFAIRTEGLGKQYRRPPTRDNQHGPETAAGALLHGAVRLATRGGMIHGQDRFWALRDVSIEIEQGEVVGVVGANGAGKTTLLKLLSRVTEPTEGRAEVRGRLSSLLEVATGFHPDLSGRDNVYLNGSILGMRRAEIDAKFDDIVEFAGVHDFIEMPVKRYSSGMYVRLAFSIAAHVEPEILLVDEVLSVGDQAFQEKSLGRLKEVTSAGRTVLFVSHNLPSLTSLCRRGILLEGGRVTMDGPIDDVVSTYLSRRRRVHGGDLTGLPRDGTGEIRFRSVAITGVDGSPEIFPDRPVVISLTFSADEPVPADMLSLSVGINHGLGERLITLWNRFDPGRPLVGTTIEDGTTITCTLQSLPLRPGSYPITLYLDKGGGEIIDRVDNQIDFTVLPSDFYGTGQLPSESQGAFMVAHEWRVERESPRLSEASEFSAP
jgi:lipopolysaccharide transport system ATP-binding protein